MNYAEWAKWYDLFYSTESGDEVEFYLEQAVASGGPVLEIGVGTGRIAIPVAERGIETFGVDASAEMLAVAEAKASAQSPLSGELTLLEADMRTLDLARKDFALVMIPARTLLLAASYDEQLATLCCAARHLRPGGKLVFNVFNPTPELIYDDSEEPVGIGEATDLRSGKRYRLSAVNRFDNDNQINDAVQVVTEIGSHGTSEAESEVARLPVRLRYSFPHELFSMLEETGLEVENVFGSFNSEPFSEDSEEIIFVARRPDS